MGYYFSHFSLSPLVAVVVLLLVAPFAAARQQPARTEVKDAGATEKNAAKGEEGESKEKRAWSLRMSREMPTTFTLKAKEARLDEITSELSRLIKAPVFVSPVLQKQRLSLEFSGMPLEATIRMLAPQSYIDYEVGGDQQALPKTLAIYLNSINEPPPSTTQVVKGNSEAILIEGDTEEGVGDEETQKKREEESPLKVSFARNNLSIRARKQPLTVVLFKIASELGIPFEMRYESPEIVDVDFNNYTVEQALRSLSTSVRLFYRTDLQNYDVQPLRIVLAAPAPAKS